MFPETITLQGSGAQTETGTGDAAIHLGPYSAVQFEFDASISGTDVADTLDVFIQTRIGSTFLDVVHFTQVVGTDNAQVFIAKIAVGLVQAEYETGTALAENVVRHIFGDAYRVRWNIVDADADASFTFSVLASFIP